MRWRIAIPSSCEKTGALVVADSIAMRWIRGTGRVDEARMATVKGLGGETFAFNGFKVEAVLGHHNVVPDEYMRKDRAAAAITLKGGLTPQQQAHDRRLAGMVPTTAEERERIITEGTIAYRTEYIRFLELWSAADPGLPELAEARAYLTRTAALRPAARATPD